MVTYLNFCHETDKKRREQPAPFNSEGCSSTSSLAFLVPVTRLSSCNHGLETSKKLDSCKKIPSSDSKQKFC